MDTPELLKRKQTLEAQFEFHKASMHAAQGAMWAIDAILAEQDASSKEAGDALQSP